MMDEYLYGIEKPGRYLGGEINARRKEFEEADARFLLAFPDVYEVGSSHLGIQLLYHALNAMEGVLADRAYAPWMDFEERLRGLRGPLRGLESRRPLNEFDFVGLSLQYELSYTNIFTILDLGRIPFRSKERRKEDPWVIAGGPCAFNPEPLADFFDFFVLGEAEEVLGELIQAFRAWRSSGGERIDLLKEVRKIPGIYVPSFFDVSYNPDGTIEAVQPHFSDYTHVKKRLVLDLDEASPVPIEPLVPMIDIVHNRLSMEIARGCTRGCRFCQAGYIYRPVRERDPRVLMERSQQALANSGFEELSVLSLSSGDYCQIQALLTALMDRSAPEKTAVSFPSMRVGTLTPQLMESIKRVRKTGFTLAPEAGSERLRRVINKGILDDDLLSAAENAFRLGWRILKLYFMIGLPTEAPEDLQALADLGLRVWKLSKPSRAAVNLSISTFVPKPQTPFQWAPQIDGDEIRERLNGLRDRLQRPGIRVKWHDARLSTLEAVFARGDRRLGQVLLRAWELGARFDGWTELFREDLWDRAFSEVGLDPAFYATRARSLQEVLPWDHLSTGVEKAFLLEELERSLNEQFTQDCRWDGCSGCGVCDHSSVRPKLHSEEMMGPAPAAPSPSEESEALHIYWLRYSRVGDVRYYGQLEIAQSISRAIRRSGLPAAYSKGFHPHLKLSFGEALPLGLESEVEEAHLTLTEDLDPEAVRLRLNRHLPEGLKVEEISQVARRTAPAANRRITYRISQCAPVTVRRIVRSWPQHLHRPIVKRTKKGELKAKLGEILLEIRPLDESSMEMDLFEGPQAYFRPMTVLELLSGETPEHFSTCRICKVAVSCLAEWEGREDVRRAHHQ